MLTALGRTVLLVHEYDEALAFYCGVLGFDVIHDSTAGNGQRFVHLAVPGQTASPRVGLWLLQADEADASLVGRQAGHQRLLVLYTPDCRKAAATLADRGVKFRKAPQEAGGAVYANFEDLYGNEIVLVELQDAGEYA